MRILISIFKRQFWPISALVFAPWHASLALWAVLAPHRRHGSRSLYRRARQHHSAHCHRALLTLFYLGLHDVGGREARGLKPSA